MTNEPKGKRPAVYMTPVVAVEIHAPEHRDAPMRVSHDDGTIQAFMEWVIERSREDERFLQGSLRGCGPHFYVGDFPIELTDEIEAWFTERGFP